MAKQLSLEPHEFGSDLAGLYEWLRYSAERVVPVMRGTGYQCLHEDVLRYNEWADAVRRLMDAEAT